MYNMLVGYVLVDKKILILFLGLLLSVFLFYFVLYAFLGDDRFFEEVMIPDTVF
ncbi:MAG TPA: hypothetical protein VL098_15350 [Flavipsychrobacter sp.]|nr:hypothetical protein [Flavipsychrobacter sp.]